MITNLKTKPLTLKLTTNSDELEKAVSELSLLMEGKSSLFKYVLNLLFNFAYLRNKLFFIKCDSCPATANKLTVTFHPTNFFRCVLFTVGAR